jgi:hypothetical protein
MLCAKKIAEAQGVSVGQHLVVTDLGIVKGPSKAYTDDNIETVVSAAWEGRGRTEAKPAPEGKKPGDGGCGCGCGGGC